MTRSHLQRKLVLLLLLTLAASLGLVILFQKNTGAPPVIFNVFADGVLGIAVGTGSRLVLRHRHWFIRAIACAGLAIIGLVVLGQLTGARSGIAPLQLLLMTLHLVERAGVRLAQLPVLGAPPGELRDVAHIVLAVTVSWVTLRAWKGTQPASRYPGKAPLIAETPLEADPDPLDISTASLAAPRQPRSFGKSRLKEASAPRPITPSPSAARHRPNFPRKSRLKTASAPRHIARARSAARHLPRSAGRLWPAALRRKRVPPRTFIGTAPTRIAGSKSRWRGILHRKPHVRLAAYEEHRCPYCLEQVQRNDPRGSMECPVCHTFHHKDCWDITGTCQVPHLNA